MADRDFANSRIYTGHVKPVLLDCSFIVAAADTGGLGITKLKGPYVQNVFMHTSATPGAGNSSLRSPGIVVTNPNPAAGTIIVQLQDGYSKLYSLDFSAVSPLGTPIKIDNSAMTPGVAYVISTLGDATAAKWAAIGVPAGVTPAVGVAFIAASDGGSANVSTSRVAPTAAAGSAIYTVELVGDSALALGPKSSAALQQGFGGQIILQCRKDTSDASAIAAPADGTLIRLKILLGDSSVLIGGE